MNTKVVVEKEVSRLLGIHQQLVGTEWTDEAIEDKLGTVVSMLWPHHTKNTCELCKEADRRAKQLEDCFSTHNCMYCPVDIFAASSRVEHTGCVRAYNTLYLVREAIKAIDYELEVVTTREPDYNKIRADIKSMCIRLGGYIEVLRFTAYVDNDVPIKVIESAFALGKSVVGWDRITHWMLCSYIVGKGSDLSIMEVVAELASNNMKVYRDALKTRKVPIEFTNKSKEATKNYHKDYRYVCSAKVGVKVGAVGTDDLFSHFFKAVKLHNGLVEVNVSTLVYAK